MKLSVIIPVFNEEKTIIHVIDAVSNVSIPNVEMEIIVVNDASKDKTMEEIKKIQNKYPMLKVYHHEKNLGKGAAVRTGIEKATGDYIVIQDADLEYNPQDIKKLVAALDDKKKIIYGTRIKRSPHLTKEERNARFLLHYVGNHFLSFITSALYTQWITDMETCYKLFPKNALGSIILHAKGFEFEPEITAKLMKKGYKIYEVSITTKPRGYAEGKKLHTVKDGLKALWTLMKYRFTD